MREVMRMRRAHTGRGLIIAGVVLILAGLGSVLVRVLQVPGYVIPIVIGAALVLAGLLRRGGHT
jgi:uncharacterized membrane protein HdeD (DUF308 family)